MIEDMPTSFSATDGRYIFEALDGVIVLIMDSVRRERHQLIGEMEVRCDIQGARTYGPSGTLLITNLNLSSAAARRDLGRLLAERARTEKTIDWAGYLEDFTQRIWAFERQGSSAEWLHEIPPASADASIRVCGFSLLRNHPQIIFAPGGSGKSLVGAALLGELGRHGVRTMVCDWEMDGGEHRIRADALALPPTILYRRCDQPLIVLADSIRRDVITHEIDFLLLDSVAPACSGRVEDAEVAIDFMKAWRRIGRGGIALAHTRAEDGDQRPFGSVFWHNLARSTWFLKRVENAAPDQVVLGVHHRKTNFGPLRSPFALILTLEQDGDRLTRVSLQQDAAANLPQLAKDLPIWQRIAHALRGGMKTVHEITTELGAKPDSVKKALNRNEGRMFTCVSKTDDGIHRWALLERRVS